MDHKNQILCTFVKKNKILQSYSNVIEHYKINRQITLFDICEMGNVTGQVLIYDITGKISNKVADTISLHKKAHSNTFYTINALNEIIKINNNGELDIKFQIEWNNYKNSLLLYGVTDGLRILQLEYIDHIIFD